jgi:chromosome segregation ATPase
MIEKSLQQLIKETEAILDSEKKKLEEKQNKTQQEMEALVDLNITYNLVDGGKNAWKDVPILFIDDKQRYTQLVNNSPTNKDQEILELKKQIQLLKQERNTFESQAEQLQSLKQEESNLQRQIKESDRQLTLLRNDFQLLHDKNIAFQNQIKTNDSKIASLQRENQELKLKTNNLEQQVREKDNKINSLENEQHGHHRMSIQQTQTLNSLKQDKQVMEQDKTNATNEMERLKSSYAILEQLLKAKEDVIMSLNRENQGNQQGANEMVDTLKSLLEAKTSETELLKQKMENALDKEKGKIKKLLKEIKRLKQHQQASSSRETRPSNYTTVPEPTTSNTGTNEDDPNNDFNYDTECGTENSSSDDTSSEDGDYANDLNYSSSDGTSSEDGDYANDLNYDSDV